MSAVVFDGEKLAREQEMALKQRIEELRISPRIMSVVFDEDQVGQTYTRLKMEAAVRVGIEFSVLKASLIDDIKDIQARVANACRREDIHGLLVQKPSKRQFAGVGGEQVNYEQWWAEVTAVIDYEKDVDCLTRVNLDRLYAGESRLMPATARAVMAILNQAYGQQFQEKSGGLRVAVVGRSELVGRPVAVVLQKQGAQVDLLGSQDNLADYLLGAEVIISATGRPGLITADLVKERVVVVDVGEPKGDVDFEAVRQKARFITPVPGGVGPMTVVSLLYNLVDIWMSR